MKRIVSFPLALLVVLAASCRSEPQPSESTPSARAKPSTTQQAGGAATSASPSEAATGCPADKRWTPKPAKVAFTWSENPTLAQAPKDGIYGSVGGEPFEIEEVVITVYKSTQEWSIRATAGPVGAYLTLKGEHKFGVVVAEKFGINRGHFQVPKKGTQAACFAETTSYNGSNARIFHITHYDQQAGTADGVLVTTWLEEFGGDRKFWVAGTFKGARVAGLD